MILVSPIRVVPVTKRCPVAKSAARATCAGFPLSSASICAISSACLFDQIGQLVHHNTRCAALSSSRALSTPLAPPPLPCPTSPRPPPPRRITFARDGLIAEISSRHAVHPLPLISTFCRSNLQRLGLQSSPMPLPSFPPHLCVCGPRCSGPVFLDR